MNNNQPHKKFTLKYIIVLVVVAVMASGATVFIYELSGKSAPLASSGSSFEEVDQLYEMIEGGYIKKVDKEKLIDGALKGMTEAVGDPHTNYLSPEKAKDFDDSVSGNFEGIGAIMTLKDGYPTVAEPPIKGSPAEKAQLKTDDVIIKIDGKDVIKDKPLEDTVKLVRGKKGTSVKLEISRGKDTFTVNIKRDTIPVESVHSSIDKNNKSIGKIEITSFNDTTSDEFNNAVTQLRKEGAKSFIVDLRGNPGGVLGEVEKIISRFLKDGETIVQFESLHEKRNADKARKELDKGDKIKEPTVLLVDEYSASASEVMASALKDTGRFEVIGEKTFGKGTVQMLLPLENGGELKLTVRKWLTPKGEWIHEKGVKPTVEVKYPDYFENLVIDTSLKYREGVISEHVKIINEYLKLLGYPIETVGDVYTAETVAAIKQFQSDQKLPETGNADEETIQKLTTAVFDNWKENDQQYQKAVEILTK